MRDLGGGYSNFPVLSPEEQEDRNQTLSRSHTDLLWVPLHGNAGYLCPWVHQLEVKATVSRAAGLFLQAAGQAGVCLL